MTMQDSSDFVSKKKALSNLLKDFCIQPGRLAEIQQRIETALKKGLTGDHDEYHYSPLKMLPTHLSLLPDGSEVGRFIAIDLGGTNLRFLEIQVVEGKLKPISVRHTVPHEVMTGTSHQLFDFIADCIQQGLEEQGMIDKEIDFLGFTFSFPCNQLALDSGILIRWTKGYCVSGVEGKDVVSLLKEACERKRLKIKGYVLINDTTGTLLCGAFENRHAKVGVINGTGTNACYLEDISHIKKWKSPENNYHQRVIINTEWGSFGDNGELEEFSTDVDREIDKTSINSGYQLFEKMISGMYIGNIVRLLLLKGIKAGIFLSEGVKEKLKDSDSFSTSLISLSYSKEEFLEKFKELFNHSLDAFEYDCIAEICDVVSIRSSNLCAVGLAAILKRIECPKGVIAADGSIFTQHPRFTSYVIKTLGVLVKNREFKIILVNDGSGKGAALAACVASIEMNRALSNDSLNGFSA